MQEEPKAAVSDSSGITVSSQMQTAIDQGPGNPDPPSLSFTPSPEEKVPQVPHFAAANTFGKVKAVGTNRIFLDICAGATRPLSRACLRRGKCVLSFDILIQSVMNLLDDIEYEQLLRLCASGSVAYAGASPSCGQYSRLKLRKGGPPPVRTPDHLNGVPGISPADLLKVQESHTMLSRCLQCLILVFQAGGHVHLEQPPSAMSWLEPEVQAFLILIGAFCINLPACAFGWSIHKAWMFATSFSALQKLGSTCRHSQSDHESIAGRHNAAGDFLSKDTACYPDSLADAFAELVDPLLSDHPVDLAWPFPNAILPTKGYDDFPKSSEDGGGLFSLPDWSQSNRQATDSLHNLRVKWRQMILDQRLDRQLLAYVAQRPSADPPFSEETLQSFMNELNHFIRMHGLTPDWSIREHQPMRLGILAALSTIMGDKDTTLFGELQAGVSTGFNHDIPLSQCFPRNDRQVYTTTLLSAHMCNWASAESDLELTRSLVEEEISRGWVYKFDGDLADAQAAFPTGVAIGKLGVATSDSRPPRLVVDNSICGLNSRCHIPERSTLPTAKDVLRSYPLRGCTDDFMAMSLDIKSAHKCAVLRESERGLVGFTLEGALYFYKVAPFGASFSAAWWSRVGGYLLRLMHHTIWIPHCGLVFVDDYLFYQIKSMMPVTAALLCVLVLCCRIPISWKKLELASTISWIGWRFHFSSGFVELPTNKLDKIRRYLQQLSQSSRTTRKDLEKFIGIMMWVTQLFPYMRIWLHYFYKDLYAIPATHFSIDRDNWSSVAPCLTDDLIFHTRPSNTAIPIQGKLISVRHQLVESLDDLSKLRLSDRRIWMRIRDPNSNKRTLSSDTIRRSHCINHGFCTCNH